MKTESLQIEKREVQALLLCGNADAAQVLLYLRSGNPVGELAESLHLAESRANAAVAALRQLGLWQGEKRPLLRGEPPRYTEEDVLRESENNKSFQQLQQEVACVLGRHLSNEDLKILLGFTAYLGLPNDVISLLISFLKEDYREHGRLRPPSLRAIEKEACKWAELGIDSFEEAVAYTARQRFRNSRRGKLLEILQLHGRVPTPGEEKYLQSWLDMGFDQQAFEIAYERTCMNTGSMKWQYMNKILLRWHEEGQHSGEELAKQLDTARGASGYMGEAELAAIRRTMQEG